MADDVLGRLMFTAADLDEITTEEVDEVWRTSIVTDPAALPPAYVEELRRRAVDRLARREVSAAS